MYRRYMSKVTAVILTAAMVTCLAGCADKTVSDEKTEAPVRSEDMEEARLEKTLSDNSFAASDAGTDKVETVYVTTDANGAVNDVIVSDWIKNPEASDEIRDTTSLSDIVNLKGLETYTDNGDGTISWDAQGSDIYYQGSSSEELPVDVHVTYTLDGREVTPDEIAGKAGHVGIRFDYDNKALEKVDIDGEETEVYVPFACVSGLMLDSGRFKNVEVTNGKTISDGNNVVVVGVSLPGLKESLDLDEAKLEKIEGVEPDISIPDHVEIEADTTDFEMGMTLTVASADVLDDLGIGSLADTDAVDTVETDMNLLTDGAGKLADGAGALKSGVTDLKAGTSAVYDGSKELYNGTVSLKDGVNTLYDGVSAYTDGASQINAGAGKLAEGAQSLADGAASARNGASTLRTSMESGDIVGNANALANGAAQVRDGASQAASGAASLKDGAAGLSTGASELASQLPGLKDGVYSLCDQASAMAGTISSVGADLTTASVAAGSIDAASLEALASALPAMAEAGLITPEQAASIGASLQAVGSVSSSLSSAGATIQNFAATYGSDPEAAATSMAALKAGADAAVTGAQSLADGASQVAAGASQVSDGLGSLSSGASQVADGASQLASGVGAVYGGVVALDDGLGTLAEGAGQLSSGAGDLYNGTSDLVSNNASLMGGIGDLKTGAGSLSDGAKSLFDGAGELDGGAARLSDGINELSDGIVKFDEEGIEKLSEAFDGSLDGFVRRVSAVDRAGRDYTSFAGNSDDMTSSVKFIIKTGAVKSRS